MAEGRENLCFVLTPWLTLSGTCPGTNLLWCLKRGFFFEAFLRLADTVSSKPKYVQMHLIIPAGTFMQDFPLV